MLTQRQKDLIDYLRQEPNQFHTQKEVAENVEGYNYIDDIRNHLSELWRDIKAINEDEDSHCFIYYKKYQCKIANLLEVEIYCDWLYSKAIRTLYRRKKIIQKNGLQGLLHYNLNEIESLLESINLYEDFDKNEEGY